MKNPLVRCGMASEAPEVLQKLQGPDARSSAWLRTGKNLWLPLSWGCNGRRSRRVRQAGFSFPELLMSILIASIIVSSLLPPVARSVESYRVIRQRRLEAIELWNEAQRFRADPDPLADRIDLGPESLTVSKRLVKSSGSKLVWEVLHVR